MPTPPPPPLIKPKNTKEEAARKEAVSNVKLFCEYLQGYAYGTRSHMPGGLDYTDFTNALDKVMIFCKARPDWTLEILKEIKMLPITEVMES